MAKQAKHSKAELMQWQALPLSVKISMSQRRIRDWVDYYGEDGVYISFSGGKDSTALVDLIDRTLPGNKIPLVFVDTGLEYPEIRDYVRSYGDRVVWLKPSKTFKEVINEYGYPFISKEVAETVYYARMFLDTFEKNQKGEDTEVMGSICFMDMVGAERRKKTDEVQEQKKAFARGELPAEVLEQAPTRVQIIFGKLKHKEKGLITNEYSKMYDKSRYKFFLDAPFEISHKCCNVMKKSPIHKYQRKSKRVPITGQMASESRLRTQKWILNGCNSFDSKDPISNPLSFWTEQDVLLYLKTRNIPIASVYGEIVEEKTDEQMEGQMSFSDLDQEQFGVFDFERPLLKTTGCQRTGCMFCGFGCTHEKEGEGRFERMKVTHPKQYEYIMKPKEEGGLNYKEVIDWINENGNFNIRY